MRYFVLALSAFLTHLVSAANLTPSERKLSLESVDAIWSTVRERHWDPSLTGPSWDQARGRARRAVQRATSMAAVRSAMSRMIATLGQTHFSIVPAKLYEQIVDEEQPPPESETPGASPERQPGRQEDYTLGIEAAVVEGSPIVISVEELSPAQIAGVRRGDIIVGVQGVALRETLSLFEGTKISERERLESDLIQSALDGPAGEVVSLEIEDAKGARRMCDLKRTKPKGHLAKLGFMPESRVWIESKRLPGNVGYVRFNMFLDPERLMPRFEQIARDCIEQQCTGFVIDLRGNPGGIGVMSMGLAGWFVKRRGLRLGTLRSKEYETAFEIYPRPRIYEGPLAILVDGASASTAEIFAAGLQDIHRARVFGSRTAGAALPSSFMKLPNGDGFQFAVAEYVSSGGRRLEQYGVTPDVVVTHTRAALLAGKDAYLEAALAWIATPK